MVINGSSLIKAEPIVDMVDCKVVTDGVSFGLGEAGYDIRIKQDVHFKEVTTHVCPTLNGRYVSVDGFPYQRGTFALASAMEEFQMPSNLVGIVHDKSSWARRGLSVFNTVIEPGWSGFLTLELVYHGQDELFIPAGSGIAQVIFSEVTHPTVYTGKYQNQRDEPVPALAATGTKCSVCLGDQFDTPSGVSCPNGHGGADPL